MSLNLKEIGDFLTDLRKRESDFKKDGSMVKKARVPGSFSSYTTLVLNIILSITDTLLLLTLSGSKVNNKRIVFTAKNFCTEENGVLEDRIVKPLFTDRILFINQSKEVRITRINNQKVYNTGGLVKLISYFTYRNERPEMRIFRAYSLINNMFLGRLKNAEVYILWFYDTNSLSIIFSKHRQHFRLIEVQHGSIINYPPYSKPAPLKIADIFYVKNQQTIDYLKENLCKGFETEYRLIPYPVNKRRYAPGLNILYASTVEFNGLHPVFKSFLKERTYNDLVLMVRLHPRERNLKHIFQQQLSEYNVCYKFDDSKNWLESINISNLIVVTPWSSSLEDAYDNGFISITIDPVGQERFNHIIDNKRGFYSDNLTDTISSILKTQPEYFESTCSL